MASDPSSARDVGNRTSLVSSAVMTAESDIHPMSSRRSMSRWAAVWKAAGLRGLETLMFHGGGPAWEQPELTSLNRLAPRATLDGRHRVPLDGTWEFALVGRPEDALGAPDFVPVEVPGLWTMQGFAPPQYTNVVMPFDDRPPTVPEANPTGVYRRRFARPAGERVVLHFGGSEGALFVTLNGEPVGIAKDARTPAEFDVSEILEASNELVVAVVQWSDASFIEDQD